MEKSFSRKINATGALALAVSVSFAAFPVIDDIAGAGFAGLGYAFAKDGNGNGGGNGFASATEESQLIEPQYQRFDE